MITAKAPGKLFIAGEYAIVSPGEPSVLIAVDRFLHVKLTVAHGQGRVYSSEYGRMPLVWKRSCTNGRVTIDHHPYDYVAAAISVVDELRAARGRDPHYFDLHITSQLDDSNGQKFGLGSSGAVVVATIDALNHFYELELSHADRYRLAMLATIQLSPRASGGDLAASTFGGWVFYRSPDRERLLHDLKEGGVTKALESSGWTGAEIRRLPTPDHLRLLVGWTGSPASTDDLVHHVHTKQPHESLTHEAFLEQSRQLVSKLVTSIEDRSGHTTLACIRQARALLQALGEGASLNIETELLAQLCDVAESHGAAAKPSGAGGGDCGIVLADERSNVHELLSDWEKLHIQRLSVDVNPGEGTSVVF